MIISSVGFIFDKKINELIKSEASPNTLGNCTRVKKKNNNRTVSGFRLSYLNFKTLCNTACA